MTSPTERDDLEQLLKAAGWLRLLEFARVEWRENYPVKIKQAIQQARDAGTDIGEAVSRIDYASDQINRLLSWPKERVARLNQPETTTGFLRGGYDPPTAR